VPGSTLRGSGAVTDSNSPGVQLALRIALATLLLAAVLRAALLSWVADDAFISFRYAANWIAGHGLVFNVGERVEGYTNFLWTVLVGGFMKAGADPIHASAALGILAYVALAGGLVHWSRHRSRVWGGPFFPLAALLVLISDDFHIWATGGLETMLFATLALQAAVWTRATGESLAPAMAAGVTFSLLVLTRPDGLLLAGAGVLSYWVPFRRFATRERLRRAAATAGPVALTLAIGIPVKWSYYGDVFPTAFYSKSVLHPYVSQGLIYVGLYLAKNWFLVFAALLLVVLGGRLAPNPPRADRWDDLFFAGTGMLFVVYIVEVGGDFMFARRLIPAVPLFLLALEGAASRLPTARLRLGFGVAVLVAAALPLPLFHGAERISGISDERAFYPPGIVAVRKRQAEMVSKALAGTDVRAAFEGGMCMFAYYSDLPYLVEMTGLTQYSLAKKPLDGRAQVGHEKGADGPWMTEHGIHLVFSQLLPPVEPDPARRRLDQVYFGDQVRARIHLYSDEVMDALREQPDVSFVPIEEVIDIDARLIERGNLATAEAIYAGLEDYYFRRAGERGAPAAARLRELIEKKRRTVGGAGGGGPRR